MNSKIFVSLLLGCLFFSKAHGGSFLEQKNDTIHSIEEKSGKISSSQFIPGEHQIPMLIKGLVPGLSVYKRGSDPAVDPSMLVRGLPSLYNTGEVLFVVDGIPCLDASFLGSLDIQSIEVVKNLSQSLQWGSMGRNGVVHITTAQGNKNRKLNISFSSQLIFEQPAKKLDLMTAEEYRALLNKKFADNPEYLTQYDKGNNTDWQDVVFRSAVSELSTLSLDGGSNGWNYAASFSFDNRNGIVQNSNANRMSGRALLGKSFLDDKIQIKAQYVSSREKTEKPNYFKGESRYNVFSMLMLNPTWPEYNQDNEPYLELVDFHTNNPINILNNNKLTSETSRHTAILHFNYQILKDLNLKIHAGGNARDYEIAFMQIAGAPFYDGGIFESFNFEKVWMTSIRPSLVYEKILGAEQNHQLAAGLLWDYNRSSKSIDYKAYYKSEDYTHGFIPYTRNTEFNAYHAFASYNFQKKYFVDARLVYEHKNYSNMYQQHFLPAFNVKWDIKQENLLKELNSLSHLSLHAGYGKSSYSFLAEYPDYAYFRLMTELTQEYNAGIHLGFFNGRLQFLCNYYNRKSQDIINLTDFSTPSSAFWLLPTSNWGEVTNNGLEAELWIQPLNRPAYQWNSRLLFALNRNKYLWPDNDDFHKLNRFYEDPVRSTDGFPLLHFNMPEFSHFLSIEPYPSMYYNLTGGFTPYIEFAGRRVVGNVMPDYEFSWNNEFRHRSGFYTNINLRAVIGHSIYNASNMYLKTAVHFPVYNALSGYEELLAQYDVPSLYFNIYDYSRNLYYNSFFLEDASFLKIDNISVGYEGKNLLKNALLGYTIFVGVNNLYTFTYYTGFDPEVNPGIATDFFNTYPSARTFILGIKVKV